MPRWIFVAASLVILCVVPFLFVSVPLPIRIAIGGALLATIAFTWWRTSSRGLSYFRGLDIIAQSFFSPSDTLNAILLPTLLQAMHVVALAISVTSRSRLRSQTRWYAFVEGFYYRRTKNGLTEIAPRPDADLPTVRDLVLDDVFSVTEKLLVPPSTQPWYRRHLLLYVPRSGTVIYHIGFFLGIFAIAAVAWAYFAEPSSVSAEDLGETAALFGFIAIGSYIAVRRNDAKHRAS